MTVAEADVDLHRNAHLAEERRHAVADPRILLSVADGLGLELVAIKPRGANWVETCRVPPPFLDLQLSGVLAPSRRLACDA
jgi:hypothetical protein